MKRLLFAVAIASLLITSCKGKDDKKKETAVTTTAENTGDKTSGNTVLDLDVTTLKDEAAFLKAWEDYTSARMDDEKKHEADNSHDDHYLEYLKMYTKLLNATTEFSKTLTPAASAVAFNEKVSAIRSKMYPTTK